MYLPFDCFLNVNSIITNYQNKKLTKQKLHSNNKLNQPLLVLISKVRIDEYFCDDTL